MKKLRISQITDATGQGWIALIRGNEIIGRFTDWEAAKAAYRAAKQ